MNQTIFGTSIHIMLADILLSRTFQFVTCVSCASIHWHRPFHIFLYYHPSTKKLSRIPKELQRLTTKAVY